LSLHHLHSTGIPQHSRTNLAVTLQFGVEATHWDYQADSDFSSKAFCLYCLYFNYTTFNTTHKTQLWPRTLLSPPSRKSFAVRVMADMTRRCCHTRSSPRVPVGDSAAAQQTCASPSSSSPIAPL
jgi:hypothetical protein